MRPLPPKILKEVFFLFGPKLTHDEKGKTNPRCQMHGCISLSMKSRLSNTKEDQLSQFV